jgi:HEAT repeat protein
MTYQPLLACLLLGLGAAALAQTESAATAEESEQLKVAAVEALISAPPEKALPILKRVLQGEGSDDLKERALFVLSQTDLPEAQVLLRETAASAEGELRYEAIRMIGIGGGPEALAGLSDLYATGDPETKEAVLEAYLIADDKDAVYRIAANAQDPEEFEEAVETLGAMGALEQLRALRNRSDMSEALIEAYAVAGDTESLRELARDGSNPERQAEAIRGLGIAGDDPDVLLDIYRNTDAPKIREAVRESLLIGDHDRAVLQLFQESRDSAEKRELLELLVTMDSEAAWEVIDSTLESGE